MKQLLVLVGCVVLLLGLAGCQNSHRSKAVEVIIEDGGEFPEFLVGRWKANKHNWEFVFEPDGTISSAVISLGKVRMTPGTTTYVPMKLGGKGVFEPGLWTVQYSKAQRRLAVGISVKRFRAELGKNLIEGSRRDAFIGTVSEDGKQWEAEWYSFPQYVAHTKQRHELAVDPNDNPIDVLVFKKTSIENN